MSTTNSTAAPKPASRKRQQIITPAGVAIWPRLETPDTKFNEDGTYSVKLRVKESDADVQAFIQAVLKVRDEKLEEQKRLTKKTNIKKAETPFNRELGEDGVTETGFITINASLKAKVKTDTKEWEQRPMLFDAQKKPLVDSRIGSGSKLVCACEINPWFVASKGVGVSLWLRAVQVIEYVEYVPGGGGKADDFGFGAVEGGYESLPVGDGDANSKSPFETPEENQAEEKANELEGKPAKASSARDF